MTKGKLFIAGGGNYRDSWYIDETFLRTISGGSLLYIPIGLNKTFAGYDGAYEWLANVIYQHQKEKILEIDVDMWVNLAHKDYSKLKQYKGVYLGGAKNTYDFMFDLNQYGFNQSLIEYYEQGGRIYGGSTGAIILGKNISSLQEDNMHADIDDTGLSLLGNFSIFCHYGRVPREKLDSFISSVGTPVIAMPETSGIIVSGKSAKVLGADPVKVINASEAEKEISYEKGAEFEL